MYVPRPPSRASRGAASSTVAWSRPLSPWPGMSTKANVGSSPSRCAIQRAHACQWWGVWVKPWRKTSRRSDIADVVFADRRRFHCDAVLQLPEDVDEGVGVLRTRDRPTAVDHERRDAGDAV